VDIDSIILLLLRIFKESTMKILAILLCLLLSQSVFAKTFTSQYTEFELPTGWECALEGSEWVCQSENKDRKKEAIIILAAKYRGEQDSLDQYQAYLKQAKSFTLPGGKTQVSEAKTVSIKEINGQRWVDALHLASEVPGFYTRYLATVKDNLGIAITFSVAKDHYDAYQEIFDKIIATIRVFDQKNASQGNWTKKKEESDLVGDVVPEVNSNVDISQKKKATGGGGMDETTSMLLIGAAVVGLLIFLKKKKKK
jgi:LPXTG-motif cell wall-anchored protein